MTSFHEVNNIYEFVWKIEFICRLTAVFGPKKINTLPSHIKEINFTQLKLYILSRCLDRDRLFWEWKLCILQSKIFKNLFAKFMCNKE